MTDNTSSDIGNKVIFVGDFGVGKTVALNNLSDIPIINTEAKSSEILAMNKEKSNKTTTTVGFDYGEWRLSPSKKVTLFGLPSQERFSPMWNIIIPGSSAVVVWAYGNTTTGVVDCKRWLKLLEEFGVCQNVCVAVTRVSDNNETVLNKFRDMVSSYLPFAPVITADPRDRDSVIQAVLVALSTPK